MKKTMTKTARKNRETVAFSFRHFGNSPGQFQRQKRKKQSKRIEMKRAGLKKNNLAMVRDNSKGKTRRNSQNDEQIRNKTGFNKKKWQWSGTILKVKREEIAKTMNKSEIKPVSKKTKMKLKKMEK